MFGNHVLTLNFHALVEWCGSISETIIYLTRNKNWSSCSTRLFFFITRGFVRGHGQQSFTWVACPIHENEPSSPCICYDYALCSHSCRHRLSKFIYNYAISRLVWEYLVLKKDDMSLHVWYDDTSVSCKGGKCKN